MNYQLSTLTKYQRGDGITGIVSTVIVFVMALKLGVAIVPAQVSDYQLTQAAESTLKKANDNKEGKDSVLGDLQRQLEINGSYGVKVEEMYTVKGGTGNLSIEKKYEVENSLFPGVFITNKFEGEIKASDAE